MLVSSFPALLVLAGCGDSNVDSLKEHQSTTECPAGVAQIGVWDGFLQNMCGCGGTPGQVIQPPNALNCTFSSGTTVVFSYLGNKVTHQIGSIGSPNFISSPPSIPTASVPVRNHTFVLRDAGTYQFIDLYNNALNGSLIVQ